MEPHQCNHENEIKRLLKIIDGNGHDGLVKEFEKHKANEKNMCEQIDGLKEITGNQAKSISGFNQYMMNQEVLSAAEEKQQRRRTVLLYFVIAQSLAVGLAFAGFLLK